MLAVSEGNAHGTRKGKKTHITSPRSGATVKCWAPGETGNPQGSSLKQRARAALAKILDTPNLEAAFKRLAQIAQDAEDDQDAVAAIRLIADTTGLKIPEEQKLVVENNVTLFDRRDGSTPAPIRAADVGKPAPRSLGTGSAT